jgi:Gene product 88
MNNRIRKGDRVTIRQEWRDVGDECFTWVARNDEEKGRVDISALEFSNKREKTTKINNKLSFGTNNAKFANSVKRATFSIPAGWTCPGASECLARVDRDSGKLTDGKDTRFRCFAATMEARRGSIRKSRWNNFELLKACATQAEMEQLILASLPANVGLVRVHVSGDFYSEMYFRAWMQVAAKRPETVFYAYTKSLKIWVNNLALVPSNFKLNASKGGRWDHLIKEHGLKYAEVVFSVDQAERLGLAIDHDDSHAFTQDGSFALKLHSTQPAGSIAAKALSALKAQGFTGYSKKQLQPVSA